MEIDIYCNVLQYVEKMITYMDYIMISDRQTTCLNRYAEKILYQVIYIVADV